MIYELKLHIKERALVRLKPSLLYYKIYSPVGMLNRLILDLLMGFIMILT